MYSGNLLAGLGLFVNDIKHFWKNSRKFRFPPKANLQKCHFWSNKQVESIFLMENSIALDFLHLGEILSKKWL